MTFPVCLPRAPALRQGLVAMLAEGALESPSVLVLAFHSSLFWVFSSGFGRGPPSPGCDFTVLVAWSLLAPRSWKPPCQSTPFARSVVHWRWCGADDSLPLVSSLSAARFGLWPYGLAIAAGLASMDRPLLVSSVESQLWGFCSWVYRASWLAQGCIPLLHLLPYF